MNRVKSNVVWLLLGLMVVFGAGRMTSGAHGLGPVGKSARPHCHLNAAFPIGDSVPEFAFCDCCSDCVSGEESLGNPAQSPGESDAGWRNGTPTGVIASGGCGRCPANACGQCCEQEYPSLFLIKSVSRITDPGRVPAAPPEDWSAAQRSLRPLLQPPRGV